MTSPGTTKPCLDARDLPIALHRDHWWQHVAKALHDAFALLLLKVGEQRVEQDHRQQRDADVETAFARLQVIGKERQCRADEKQQREEVRELAQELDDLGGLFAYAQFIATELEQSLGGVGAAQSVPCAAQALPQRFQRNAVLVSRHSCLVTMSHGTPLGRYRGRACAGKAQQ
jgi:hypothetical protein